MAFTEHIKVALGLESAGFKKGLTGAESKSKSFAKNVKGYLAGALAVGALVKTTKTIVDFGATIGDVSDRLGVSAEFLQEFQYSATQSGSSAEEASKALEKLSKSVGEAEIGTKLYKDAFDRLGVSLRDADGNLKSTEQITRDVANGLKSIDDPAVKVKTAFDLMGRAGTAMIQTMAGGEQGLDEFAKQARKMGLVVGNDSVKALQDASGKIEIMERSWKVLLADVAPAVTDFFRGLVATLKLVKASFSGIGDAVEVFGKTMKKVISNNIEKQFNKVEIKLAELKLAFAEFNPFADQKNIKRLEDNLKNLKSRQIELNNSALGFKDAKNEVFKEDERLADAQKKYQRELKQVQATFSDIFSEKTEKQKEVNSLTEEEKELVAQVAQERTKEEVAISRTIEKQQALQQGGLDALQVLQDRFDLEDQIQKLVADGTMSQEEAKKKALEMLDAQQQELDLQQQIKQAKEEQNALTEKAEEREKLLADLQAEIETRTQQIEIQKQVADLDAQIDQARANGNVALEQQLENQRMQIELGKLEFDQAIELEAQLQKELQAKQDIRNEAKLELDILQARANGNDDLADALEVQLQIQKDVANIAQQQEITEREALGQVQQRIVAENEIALKKLQTNKQDIIDGEVRKLAEKDIKDARNTDERARIRRAKKVQALEKQIVELREKGTDQANKMADDLEKKKQGFLEVVLDDKTKEDLKNLDIKEQDIKNAHDLRIQELQKEAQKIRDEEADAKLREEAQLQKLEDKKMELIQEEEKIAKELLKKVENTELEAEAEFSQSAKTTLNDWISNFRTAIDNFEMPSLSDFMPVNSKNEMKIDTDGLASDDVLKEISRKLDGKYKNE